MSDSSKEIILLVGQNLFFLGRVENLAEPLGYEVQYTTTESAFWDAYGSGQIALFWWTWKEMNQSGAKSWRVSASKERERLK